MTDAPQAARGSVRQPGAESGSLRQRGVCLRQQQYLTAQYKTAPYKTVPALQRKAQRVSGWVSVVFINQERVQKTESKSVTGFQYRKTMNSRAPNTTEQPLANFLEVCKRRFPTHCVGGNGRYAVYAPAAGPLSKILLFETYREARNMILDPRYAQVIDLGAPLVDLEKMPDRHYERERR
jgi:hypothetical protein